MDGSCITASFRSGLETVERQIFPIVRASASGHSLCMEEVACGKNMYGLTGNDKWPSLLVRDLESKRLKDWRQGILRQRHMERLMRINVTIFVSHINVHQKASITEEALNHLVNKLAWWVTISLFLSLVMQNNGFLNQVMRMTEIGAQTPINQGLYNYHYL